MKNIYYSRKQDVLMPKQKTIDFILNYSKSLNNLSLNGIKTNCLIINNRN